MSDKQFVEECVAAMNHYRVIHHVAPLSYNPEIEKVAKAWAQHLASTNGFEHNPKPLYRGKEMGENIASSWSSNNQPISGDQSVEQWYREIERYDFKTHGGPKTGHFTQLVWKDSKEVGVGRAQGKDGTWLVVANYFPPGNYVGENAKNVFPPKDGKIPQPIRKDSSQSDGHAHGNVNTAQIPPGAFRREVRTEKMGNVTKTITTETAAGHDGVTTITITERTVGPGPVTRTKVTQTVRRPDGSSSTKTTETEERGK